jgi:Rho-binding antiterminator
MTDYTSIDCGLHSEFELAIMHKKHLQLSWQLPGKEKQSRLVKPVDLIARHHEEFLLIEDEQGEHLEIRLDYITIL